MPLAAGALAACGPPAVPGVLATFAGGEVTVARLDALLRGLPAARRQPPADQPVGEWLEERIADAALSDVLLERARSSPLSLDPALLLRARYLASQEIGRRFLHRRCPPEEIAESELRQAFDRDFPREPQPWILVRHIYKRVSARASAGERQAARRALEEIEAALAAGASFVELARQRSDSETAEQGGLIGRISRQAPIEPRVRDAAWQLADGERSGLVEVDNGFHIILRVESGVSEPRSFEQVHDQLRQQMVVRRQGLCGNEILSELGRETPVTVDHEALGAGECPTCPPSEVVLSVGRESFTLEQLAGLSPDYGSLARLQRPVQVLRNFAEALLLAEAARVELPETGERFEQAREAALGKLLVDAQWRAERQRLMAGRPESELRAYYEEHTERFRSDLELDVGMILVSAGERPGRRAALARATELHERIRAGESFEALAREQSEHRSREQDGRLGPLPLPRLRVILGSRAIARVTALAEGEISAPVVIRDPPHAAFVLLKLYRRQDPRPRPYMQVRDELVAVLARERVRQLDAEVRERLREEIDMRVRPAAVEAYLAGLHG